MRRSYSRIISPIGALEQVRMAVQHFVLHVRSKITSKLLWSNSTRDAPRALHVTANPVIAFCSASLGRCSILQALHPTISEGNGINIIAHEVHSGILINVVVSN